MKKAEFIKEIIEGYSWSPGEKLEFSKEALRLLLIIVLNEAKNLEDVGGIGKISFVPASITFNSTELTITDDSGENSEVLNIENGSTTLGNYTMGVNLMDLKAVLDSCKNEHITINCGNHKSIVINRGTISNIIPETITKN